jgi:hypothetical protein
MANYVYKGGRAMKRGVGSANVDRTAKKADSKSPKK